MPLTFHTVDAAMAVRLKRQLMGFFSYFMFLAPLIYAVQNHWMAFGWAGVLGFCLAAVFVNIVFFCMIRSGYSLRFKDPSLTLAQIVVSLVLALWMVRLANEARPVFLLLFFAAFFFGVFGLTQRQFRYLALGTVAGYGAVVGIEFWHRPLDEAHFKLEALQFMALAMLLFWMALIGGYVAQLRAKVAQQKTTLAETIVQLRKSLIHDDLTGVFNRRHLLDLMEHEKACADRHSTIFSVCLLDIDHFKQINDTYGHATGDEVLAEFASRMKQHARKMDRVGRGEEGNSEVSFGRFGGEEFMVVMPHTPLAGAVRGMERLRLHLQEMPVHTKAGDVAMTFSAGVAQHQPNETVAQTLGRADKALYQAKGNGRNQTQAAD